MVEATDLHEQKENRGDKTENNVHLVVTDLLVATVLRDKKAKDNKKVNNVLLAVTDLPVEIAHQDKKVTVNQDKKETSQDNLDVLTNLVKVNNQDNHVNTANHAKTTMKKDLIEKEETRQTKKQEKDVVTNAQEEEDADVDVAFMETELVTTLTTYKKEHPLKQKANNVTIDTNVKNDSLKTRDSFKLNNVLMIVDPPLAVMMTLREAEEAPTTGEVSLTKLPRLTLKT